MSADKRPLHHAPVWINAWVETTERHYALRSFLSAVFRWTWEVPTPEAGSYCIAYADSTPVLGLGVADDASGELITYFSTTDVEASLRHATDLGARVTSPPVTYGVLGTSALIVDPFGATLGLWGGGSFAGFGESYDVNTAGWFDHRSNDPEAASAFYQRLTGHDVATVSDDLRVLSADDRWLAGFSSGDGGRPRWVPIFVVDSLERVRTLVPRLGGAIVLDQRLVADITWCAFREPVNGSVITVMVGDETSPAASGDPYQS